MKNIAFILFLLVLGVSGYFFAVSKKSDCFSPDFVMSAACFDLKKETLTPEATSDDVKTILSQTFTFLGSGNQSYAFVSADGKYVFKVMKLYQNRNEPWKFKRLLDGFMVADLYDREHTGILYTHLTPTENLNLTVHLLDKAGRHHNLSLDPLIFALQLKATPTRDAIAGDLNRGDKISAKKKIESLLSMMQEELSHGVYDADHNIWHNTGFIGEKPIRIDVGKLKLDERMKDPQAAQIEIEKIKNERIHPWLKRYFPSQIIF